MLGMGVRGICVVGALLWGGAASAQVVCGTVTASPRAEVSPSERGGPTPSVKVVPPGATPSDISLDGDRRVEIWSVPEAPIAGCGSRLILPSPDGPRPTSRLSQDVSRQGLPSRDAD